MRKLIFFLSAVACTMRVAGADVTPSGTPTHIGKKDGKISLAITGGFAPFTFYWTGPSGYAATWQNPDSLAAGVYCVTVTDKYCGKVQTCITIAETSNAISEMAASGEALKAYPNPFTDEINIALPAGITGPVNCSLSDMQGRVVARARFSAATQLTWKQAQALPSGVYLLQAETENGPVLRARLVRSAP